MKHKTRYILLAVLLCALVLLLSAYLLHRTFFQRLDFEDISDIYLYSDYYHDGENNYKTPLSEEDALSVYNLLRQLPLKRIEDTTLAGFYPFNAQMFLIKLTDGRSIQLGVTASRVFINGKLRITGDYAVGTELQNLHYTLNQVYFLWPEQP